MRKKEKQFLGHVIFWIMFLPIWVAKRIILNMNDVYKESKILQSGIENIDTMSGVEFEEYLAAFFTKRGYDVELTATTGDFGADLILEGDGFRTAVQAKRYSDLVGLDAVREVLGARDYYKANKLMVITNNYFTNAAKKQAESSNVILWDRGSLIQEITDEPEHSMTIFEFTKSFAANTLADYKLIGGLLAVFLVYIPIINSVISEPRYPLGEQYSNESQNYSQSATNDNQRITIVGVTQPDRTLEEVTRELSYSKKRPGYLRYKNGRFGYLIEFPEEFSPASPPENGSGFTFVSSSGGQLNVYGVNNSGHSIEEIYRNVIGNVSGNVGFKVLGKTYFVVTWTENGTLYYRKSFIGKGSENTFFLTLPESQKPYFDVIIEIIEDSFRRGNINVAH